MSPAECLPTIETNSVQLLTAFAAAHWFDLKKFFEESDRVLVDNGVIALVGYSFPTPIDPDNQDDKSLSQLMIDTHNDPRIAPFNSLKITPTENHYRDVEFPKNYEFVHKEGIKSDRQANAQTLIGRLESSSRYQVHLQRDRQSAEQLIQEFERNLKTILKTEKLNEKELILRYDYFIAMGRKKVDC